jgi:hypothetical protein
MRLELGYGRVVETPTPQAIAEDLATLRVPGCEFAVLEADRPGFYMQAAKNQDGSFILEHQEGSLGKHYNLPYTVDLEDVIEAFSSYLLKDDRWRKNHGWEKMELKPGTSN